MLSLVLGGARSGKSRFAASLCGDGPVVYVATACPDGDREMHDRIARHRRDRPPEWTTVEEAEDAPAAVSGAAPPATVLVDCVTIWVSNLLWKHRDLPPDAQEQAILRKVAELPPLARDRDLVVVSNDVGSAVVPEHPVARRFRDVQGLANQLLAREAGRVVLVVAGLPLYLKGRAEPPVPARL